MKGRVDDMECNRCKHRWASRVQEPKQCPHCHDTIGLHRIAEGIYNKEPKAEVEF